MPVVRCFTHGHMESWDLNPGVVNWLHLWPKFFTLSCVLVLNHVTLQFFYQEVESIPPFLEAELNDGTCFGEWEDSRCDTSRILKKWLHISVCTLVFCHSHDEKHPDQPSRESKTHWAGPGHPRCPSLGHLQSDYSQPRQQSCPAV